MTVKQVEGTADERREDSCGDLDDARSGWPGWVGAVCRMKDRL